MSDRRGENVDRNLIKSTIEIFYIFNEEYNEDEVLNNSKFKFYKKNFLLKV
jgi:hypothetical protein